MWWRCRQPLARASVWSSPRLTAGECRAQGACLGRPRRRNQLHRQSVASAWGNSPALRARRYEHDVAAPQSALLPSPVDNGTTRGGCPTSYATAIAGATIGRAHGWTRRNRSGRGFNDRRFDQPSPEARPLFPSTVIHVTPEPARSNLGSRKVGRPDGSAVRLVVEDDVEVEPGRDRVEALEVVLQESLALGSSRGSIERTFSRASLSVGFFSRSASLRVS